MFPAGLAARRENFLAHRSAERGRSFFLARSAFHLRRGPERSRYRARDLREVGTRQATRRGNPVYGAAYATKRGRDIQGEGGGGRRQRSGSNAGGHRMPFHGTRNTEYPF